MAEGAHVKKSVRQQFERHHEAMSHEDWGKKSYPNYKQQAKIPNLNFVEFGKTFDIPVSAVVDEQLVQISYQTVLADFFKTKTENFPKWEGLPTIKVQDNVDSLRRIHRIGWYAQVPNKYVINPDDKLEEDLWNS